MVPRPHANVVGLDVAMNEASSVKNFQWLTDLSKQIKHDACSVIRFHFQVTWRLRNKLLYRYATGLHLDLSD